jgi:hypothetical protein
MSFLPEGFEHPLYVDVDDRHHLRPIHEAGTDAVISWWTVDAPVGSPVATALDAAVPVWIAAESSFRRPHFGVV